MSQYKTDFVRSFIKKNKGLSKKEIARQLYEANPEMFNSIERARDLVRHVSGSKGTKSQIKKNEEVISYFREGFDKWAKQNLNIEDRPWDEPFIIPDSISVLNVIADLHSVHLDYKVLQQFLKSTKDKTAVLLNGDLMDSESLTRHIKGHNVIEYEKELEICHQILKGLKQEFNHVYFKLGNHDFWLERYLLTNARDVFKLLGLELHLLLRCPEIGVQHINNLKYIKYGDLDIIHGHEFSSSYGAGKFPAAGFVDKWQTFKKRYDIKILASHCHRQDYVVSRRSKDGLYSYGWVTPAMCRKSASYNPYAGWDNGWAVLRNKDGKTSVELTVL